MSCARPLPVFNESRAFGDLVRQTEFGPRVPGTDSHARCAEWIATEMRKYSASVTFQEFTGIIPGQPDSISMRNIIAQFGPKSDKRVLLSAHWDTRPFADLDPDSTKHRTPVLGANDGASGVAVLMELARLFDSIPPPIGVDVVLYDGEDAGEYAATPGHWCQGSLYFAAHLPVRYQWAINVDIVGDRDLAIPIEGHSMRLAPDLVDRVWDHAERIGETAFQRVRGPDVFDDHMPILMRGIPAIDLIDIDYVYWHTTEDTVDKCAPESLGKVGRVLVSVIYD